MTIPTDLKYSKEHEWVKIHEGNTALIGITDFAQGELGELVYIEVETVGEELGKDEVFGTVEAVKTTSDLYMPVAGKIIEFNPELNEDEGDNPGIINTDPYEEGWIVKIEISDMAELDEMMDSGAYEALTSA